MRRRRIIRNACLAAAVLLGVGWGLSLFGFVEYEFAGGRTFGAGKGVIGSFSEAESFTFPGWHAGLYLPELRVTWLPVYEENAGDRVVLLPIWMACLVAAGLALWRWRADRVVLPYLCSKCGYDRRGLAADAKCPECGTIPAPAKK